MAEKGVRIRLKFQDAGILTKQQIDQGLAQCWHLVRFDDVRTIAEVASDIRSVFNLGESCPNGLGLEVDGFALPPSQSAQLLKDSDLVRIKRIKDSPSTPGAEVPHNVRNVRNDQHFVINGYRYASYGGLELRAIDEFEKETGGYKSEEEEGEMETDISLDGGARTLGDPEVAPIFLKEMERGSKKRKRAKDPVTELGKKKRNSGNELALSLANSEAKQEKLKANKVSRSTGVSLRALDEFERELGGYESEQEEDENEEETDFSLGGTKNVIPFEVRPLGTTREEKRVAKKQKNSKKAVDIRNDGQMQQLKSAVNDIEEEQSKKKRNRNSEVKVSRQTEDVVEMCPVKSKERKKSKRAERAEDLQSKDEKLDAPAESSRKKRSKEQSKSHVDLAPTVRDDLSDTLLDSDDQEDQQRNDDGAPQGGATNLCTPVKDWKFTPGDDTHRPSRSARRKKAKRKWLREQQAKAEKLSTEEDVVKKLPSNEEIVEVETVEEALPFVVRVGHIRFEPQDEDDCGAPSGSSPPVLNCGQQLKSKRQGQNWGQEKTSMKQKGKTWIEETENVECLEANVFSHGECKNKGLHVDLAKLPALQGAPQEGDAIAYRLVELSTSWTPELSPYRVGVVVSVDMETNGVKLAPHPDYPFCGIHDTELGDTRDEESGSYRPPYDEDGFLETDVSSLVDMRLLEKKLGSKRSQVGEESGKQVAEDKRSDTFEGGPSLAPPILESVERMEISVLSNTQIGNETELLITEGSGQIPTVEMKSTKASGDEKETGKDVTSSPDWQTQLTKELQRKKLEIRQKTVDSGGNKTSKEPVKTASKRGKSKYLRSAGVGTIVALLRAQQAL